MRRYYPVYLQIEGRLCVVVGGGGVGTRKAAGLVEAGACVRVVSPQVSEELETMEQSGTLTVVRDMYSEAALRDAWLVFAATSDSDANARIVADAKLLGIPANSADAPEEADFIVPATVRRGELCIAISTGSASPKLAARLRRELEERFAEDYASYIELLGKMRSFIKLQTSDIAKRALALEMLLDHEQSLRNTITSSGLEAAMDEAKISVERALE